MQSSIVDAAENALKRSRYKVEKYNQSMIRFGASDAEINHVTGNLIERNRELADMLHDIEMLQEKLKSLNQTDNEQQILHFKELGGVIEEATTALDENDQDGSADNQKAEHISAGNNAVPISKRRYSLLVAQLKKSLRLVETGEFILIPSKIRGRMGRLELNEIVRKVNEVFCEKYICQKRPPLALKNPKKQECEKLRGRCYASQNELLARFTAKEKFSWKFALPCLVYLNRLEEVKTDDIVCIAAILS